jgi:hypothetical protein
MVEAAPKSETEIDPSESARKKRMRKIHDETES